MADRQPRRRTPGGDAGASWQVDQAAGLRRLFAKRSPQMIAFASGREAAGRTAIILQTAAALAASGSSVLLVDENAGSKSLSARLGINSRADLLQVLRRECGVADVVTPIAPLVGHLSAARMVRDLPKERLLPDVVQARLAGYLREMQRDAEFILIDCLDGRSQHLSPLSLAASHIAIVVAAQNTAITHAYSLIKRLAQEGGRENFQIVITRARGEAEAQAIFANMKKLSFEQLGIRLNFLGAVGAESSGQLAHALKSRLPAVVENGAMAGAIWPAAGGEHTIEESRFAIR